ncbi:hypothetical protein GGI25_004764 [Coemansia spiralis]|uniref:Uncharacterized protein n=2 Tax=Coemansia TaxID=4863 RepID=A0A9W8G3V3_9FUNG|nr:hypothetical protein EDC05_006162 [Coemansia umbellata]KAJ2620065.1 hypothetical protein GGI26_005297 [Coemansia sp. RSA 1358]KAJ2673245.1 hypothetical protein GGI25_004764 [Coemansia spiralis]
MSKVNVVIADRSSTKIHLKDLDKDTTYAQLIEAIKKKLPTFNPEKETLKSGSMGKMTKDKTLADYETTDIYFELSRT